MARRRKHKAIRQVLLFVWAFGLIAAVAITRDIYSYAGWVALTVLITAAGFAAGWRAQERRRLRAVRKTVRNAGYGRAPIREPGVHETDIRSAYPAVIKREDILRDKWSGAKPLYREDD